VNDTIAWLLDGDPAIRWQAMRDLLGDPAWKNERTRTAEEGWGARLLAEQAPDGSWGGGVYSPKWISTTYTILNLIDIGIPPDHPMGRKGADVVIGRQLGPEPDNDFQKRLANLDRCIVGMDLQIASYFGIADERVDKIVENLLAERMPDGGWNCRRGRKPKPPHHSSFHTTLNVLDGLRQWLENSPAHPLRGAVEEAEKSAIELLLQHRLFKSDKTGEVIDPKFALFSFPLRWHYDALRGLAHLARANVVHDLRCADAIALLESKRTREGTWPVQNRYSGQVFFHMEPLGKSSRWNTLRALRVLKWWENRHASS
jgi:hypothetical protein